VPHGSLLTHHDSHGAAECLATASTLSQRRYDAAAVHRPRLTYALLAATIVVAGLAARHLRSAAPGILTTYLGDTLWPVLFFLLFAIALPRAATRTVALLTLATTLGIEFSQLYHAPWLDALRATPPGRLLLGNTFLWSDVACLVVGTAIAAGCEAAVRGRGEK
jgi:hypothetical protein